MRENEHSHISRARRDFRGRNMVARSLAEKMKFGTPFTQRLRNRIAVESTARPPICAARRRRAAREASLCEAQRFRANDESEHNRWRSSNSSGFKRLSPLQHTSVASIKAKIVIVI
jgi:hypothetical protein